MSEPGTRIGVSSIDKKKKTKSPKSKNNKTNDSDIKPKKEKSKRKHKNKTSKDDLNLQVESTAPTNDIFDGFGLFGLLFPTTPAPPPVVAHRHRRKFSDVHEEVIPPVVPTVVDPFGFFNDIAGLFMIPKAKLTRDELYNASIANLSAQTEYTTIITLSTELFGIFQASVHNAHISDIFCHQIQNFIILFGSPEDGIILRLKTTRRTINRKHLGDLENLLYLTTKYFSRYIHEQSLYLLLVGTELQDELIKFDISLCALVNTIIDYYQLNHVKNNVSRPLSIIPEEGIKSPSSGAKNGPLEVEILLQLLPISTNSYNVFCNVREILKDNTTSEEVFVNSQTSRVRCTEYLNRAVRIANEEVGNKAHTLLPQSALYDLWYVSFGTTLVVTEKLFIEKFNDYLRRTAITNADSSKLCTSFLAVLFDWRRHNTVKDTTNRADNMESQRGKQQQTVTTTAVARATGTIDSTTPNTNLQDITSIHKLNNEPIIEIIELSRISRWIDPLCTNILTVLNDIITLHKNYSGVRLMIPSLQSVVCSLVDVTLGGVDEVKQYWTQVRTPTFTLTTNQTDNQEIRTVGTNEKQTVWETQEKMVGVNEALESSSPRSPDLYYNHNNNNNNNGTKNNTTSTTNSPRNINTAIYNEKHSICQTLLNTTGWVVVYGPQRSGKTTKLLSCVHDLHLFRTNHIANNINATLGVSSVCDVVYVNFLGVHTESNVINRLNTQLMITGCVTQEQSVKAFREFLSGLKPKSVVIFDNFNSTAAKNGHNKIGEDMSNDFNVDEDYYTHKSQSNHNENESSNLDESSRPQPDISFHTMKPVTPRGANTLRGGGGSNASDVTGTGTVNGTVNGGTGLANESEGVTSGTTCLDSFLNVYGSVLKEFENRLCLVLVYSSNDMKQVNGLFRTLHFGNKYYIATSSAKNDAQIATAAEKGVKVGGRPAGLVKSRSIGSHLSSVHNTAKQLAAGRAVINAMIEIGPLSSSCAELLAQTLHPVDHKSLVTAAQGVSGIMCDMAQFYDFKTIKKIAHLVRKFYSSNHKQHLLPPHETADDDVSIHSIAFSAPTRPLSVINISKQPSLAKAINEAPSDISLLSTDSQMNLKTNKIASVSDTISSYNTSQLHNLTNNEMCILACLVTASTTIISSSKTLHNKFNIKVDTTPGVENGVNGIERAAVGDFLQSWFFDISLVWSLCRDQFGGDSLLFYVSFTSIVQSGFLRYVPEIGYYLPYVYQPLDITVNKHDVNFVAERNINNMNKIQYADFAPMQVNRSSTLTNYLLYYANELVRINNQASVNSHSALLFFNLYHVHFMYLFETFEATKRPKGTKLKQGASGNLHDKIAVALSGGLNNILSIFFNFEESKKIALSIMLQMKSIMKHENDSSTVNERRFEQFISSVCDLVSQYARTAGGQTLAVALLQSVNKEHTEKINGLPALVKCRWHAAEGDVFVLKGMLSQAATAYRTARECVGRIKIDSVDWRAGKDVAAYLLVSLDLKIQQTDDALAARRTRGCLCFW